MKALFVKELTDGRWLVLFGAALGVLTVIVGQGHGPDLPLLGLREAGAEWAVMAAAGGAMLVALIGGVGLFASELKRGTLPVLLALPLSRRRIWVAKVGAGLLLALLASGLIVLPTLATTGYLWELAGVPYGWAALLWWLVMFSAAVFWSTLLEQTLGALMAAIVWMGALIGFVAMEVSYWGGHLTGCVLGVDQGLWAIAAVPGLLLGSLVALSRGELLRSGRKWVLGAGVLVPSTAALMLLIVGGFRWTTRYQRARVQEIVPVSLSADDTVATLDAMRVGDPGDSRTKDRTRHLVVTDLEAGRDLIVRRGEGVAAVSPDRRLVALVPEPFALTYDGASGWLCIWKVEIRNLRTGRLLYRGWPDKFREYRSITSTHGRIESVAWSPDGSWVALQGRPAVDKVLLLRPDGSEAVAIPVWPHVEDPQLRRVCPRWDWDASGGGVYALTLQQRSARDPRLSGRMLLVHHRLPGGRTTDIWDPLSAAEMPAPYDWLTARLSVSPDGRWIAAGLAAVPFGPTGTGSQRAMASEKALVFVFLVAADGTRSLPISQTSLDNGFESLDFVWSKDSKRLYYLARSRSSSDFELRLWRDGQAQSAALTLPAHRSPRAIALLPQTGDLLIWSVGDILVADEAGEVHPFPNERVRSRHRAIYRDLLGLDEQGRAIVQGGPGALAAVDLTTGELTQIYP